MLGASTWKADRHEQDTIRKRHGNRDGTEEFKDVHMQSAVYIDSPLRSQRASWLDAARASLSLKDTGARIDTA
jgi:hypothetical protein